jgi:serine/threonine protein kinase
MNKLETVGKNFKIIKKIDEGSYGEIYKAINTRTNIEYAVKIEDYDTSNPLIFY